VIGDDVALRMARHFAHKVPVTEEGGVTRVETRFGAFELRPAGEALAVALFPAAPEDRERLREVVESHAVRFARGEELRIEWA
jgi:hypothetical protein